MNGLCKMFGISEQELDKIRKSTEDLEQKIEDYQRSNLEKFEQAKKENA